MCLRTYNKEISDEKWNWQIVLSLERLLEATRNEELQVRKCPPLVPVLIHVNLATLSYHTSLGSIILPIYVLVSPVLPLKFCIHFMSSHAC
jgi:hypothetical protein